MINPWHPRREVADDFVVDGAEFAGKVVRRYARVSLPAEDDDLVLDAGIGNRTDIQHGEIHAHPADDGNKMAVDYHLPARG